MPLHQTYTTQRLFIKPTEKEDAAFILELFNTPKWKQFIGDRNLKTITEAETYITQKMLPQRERLGFSNYTVLRKSDGIKIGTCGLYDREGVQGIDLGFALLPAYEKQGYAYEASKRVMEAAFFDFGYKTLSGITVKNNYASQALLEKLGFIKTGTLTLPNDNTPLFLYQFTFSVEAES
ncbi:MAG TPA: GNAT family N-acetyltransferase [Flavobacteriaceae bacterium]|nr:GNAT family N-acetyltransferase [Flavobacteriaceae bacterium]